MTEERWRTHFTSPEGTWLVLEGKNAGQVANAPPGTPLTEGQKLLLKEYQEAKAAKGNAVGGLNGPIA
jgi:hypothetical protein